MQAHAGAAYSAWAFYFGAKMATPEDTELLDATRVAFLDVLQNGQHIAASGRVYTKADLPELRMTIDWLESKTKLSTAGGTFDRMKTGVPYRA